MLVGEKKYPFTVHQAILHQSKELESLHCNTSKKSRTKGSKCATMLFLPNDDPKDIGQLLEFLYRNEVVVRKGDPNSQAAALLGFWNLACKYKVVAMRKQTIEKLEELSIATKILPMKFVRLASLIYEADFEDTNGDVQRYFKKHAIPVLSKMQHASIPALEKMIADGGSFASDLFAAYSKSFGPAMESAPKTAAKPQGNLPLSKRQRIDESISTTAPTLPDARTEEDKDDHIPLSWAEVSDGDKLLITMAEESAQWTSIASAYSEKTGHKESISRLLHRYNRIDATMLRVTKLDSDLLLSSKTEVETEFTSTAQWSLIATRITQKGGHRYDPMTLRHHHNVLAKTPPDITTTANIPASSSVTNFRHIYRPTLGIHPGIRISNTKAINPRRKRERWEGPAGVPTTGVAVRRTVGTRSRVAAEQAMEDEGAGTVVEERGRVVEEEDGEEEMEGGMDGQGEREGAMEYETLDGGSERHGRGYGQGVRRKGKGREQSLFVEVESEDEDDEEADGGESARQLEREMEVDG
ncbi:MAG: hypothetical protein Q9220_003873 [cf. Caloplaca sp. 1 TL-2023]